MHAARYYRHGDPMIVLLDGSARTPGSHGYVTLVRRGHPLADAGGRVYEHRLVLWEQVGGTDQECAWCGDTVAWFAQVRSRRLVVDHVDTNRSNNSPTNLVPACHPCNVRRTGLYKLEWTHCPNGHEYTPANQVASVRDSRKCKECRRERQRRYEARKRAGLVGTAGK